jgi:hypothetical protein
MESLLPHLKYMFYIIDYNANFVLDLIGFGDYSWVFTSMALLFTLYTFVTNGIIFHLSH